MTPPQALPPTFASLDGVRLALQPPVRGRTPLWALVLAAVLAASAGVSAAGIMILGPSGGATTAKSVLLSR